MGFDTDFLISKIGDVLAKGCAEVAFMQPTDPIHYLGTWLIKQVENKEKEEKRKEEKKEEILELRKIKEKEFEEKREIEEFKLMVNRTLEEFKKKVNEGYFKDPYILWEYCLEMIEKCTDIDSCYVAVVTNETEKIEEEINDNNDEINDNNDEINDSNDNNDDVPCEIDRLIIVREKEIEEEEKQDEDEGEETNVAKKIDYSNKKLEYVIGSTNQSFINEYSYTLSRPKQEETSNEEEASNEEETSNEETSKEEEEEEEDSKELKKYPPPVFKLLDKEYSSIFVKMCHVEPGMYFLRQTPKLGSFFACALKSSDLECRGILCCDSLTPPGNGLELKDEDLEFVWNVSNISNLALDKFLEGNSFDKIACRNKITDLHTEIRDTYEKYDNPEKQEDNDIEDENINEKQEDNDIEDENINEKQEDNDIEDENINEEVVKLEELIDEEKKVLALESEKLKLEKDVLSIILRYLKDGKIDWINRLSVLFYCPDDTFNIITAVYHLLDKIKDNFNAWKHYRKDIKECLFENIEEYDITKEIDIKKWNVIKKHYSIIEDQNQLENELNGIGTYLLLWIKQIYRVFHQYQQNKKKELKLNKKENDLIELHSKIQK